MGFWTKTLFLPLPLPLPVGYHWQSRQVTLRSSGKMEMETFHLGSWPCSSGVRTALPNDSRLMFQSAKTRRFARHPPPRGSRPYKRTGIHSP